MNKSKSKSKDQVAIIVRMSRERRQRLRDLVAAEGLRRNDLAFSLQRFCEEALGHWETHVRAHLGMTPEEFFARLHEAMGAGDA